MDGVTIRRALPDDLPALAELQWRWRIEEWSGRPAVDRHAFSAALRIWADGRQTSHPALLAKKQGRAVGMGWLATVERVPTPVTLTRLSGHVQSLYVVPEERGHGVGSEMLRRLIEEAGRMGFDQLLVHPSVPSIPLYRRHGFVGSGDFMELRIHQGTDRGDR
jgi:GNAT superfamily N-acetyltransferase